MKTVGLVKGRVSYVKVLDLVKELYDENATTDIYKMTHAPIEQIKAEYEMNKSSQDDTVWYSEAGYVYFMHEGEKKRLFYTFSNVRFFDERERYTRGGIEEALEEETTSLKLKVADDSVEIIKALVEKLGGGWVDENDCKDGHCYTV